MATEEETIITAETIPEETVDTGIVVSEEMVKAETINKGEPIEENEKTIEPDPAETTEDAK